LSKEPCQCHLPRRRMMFLTQFLETLHELQDIWEILCAKPDGKTILSPCSKATNYLMHTGGRSFSSRHPGYHHAISK
jgi:hypothetical protein